MLHQVENVLKNVVVVGVLTPPPNHNPVVEMSGQLVLAGMFRSDMPTIWNPARDWQCCVLYRGFQKPYSALPHNLSKRSSFLGEAVGILSV